MKKICFWSIFSRKQKQMYKILKIDMRWVCSTFLLIELEKNKSSTSYGNRMLSRHGKREKNKIDKID